MSAPDPLTRSVPVGARHVLVRELTVSEVRAHLAALPDQLAHADLIGACLVDGVLLADLPRFTDLQPHEMETLTPSQIRALWEEVKTINTDFFTLMARLVQRGGVQTDPDTPADAPTPLQPASRPDDASLNTPSTPLSPTATPADGAIPGACLSAP